MHWRAMPGPKATSKAPAPPLPPHQSIDGFKACTPGTHELIVDPKGWCSIPFDTSEDGFKSFRVLIVPRGKTTHVPGVPGRYALMGTYQTIVAPVLVHFTEASGRKPELVTSFTDFAIGNDELSGVAANTLELPLKQGHNKYRASQNVTNLENVIGFSPVPNVAPYTVDLEPTFKANAIYSRLKILKPADVVKFIDTALAERVERLFKHAADELEQYLSDIAKAGSRTAEIQRGLYQAKLTKLKELIGKLPPQAYDARLHTRFTVIGEDAARPEWMASPLRTTMQEGGAQLIRTRLQKAAAAAAEISPPRPRRLPGTDAAQEAEAAAEEEAEEGEEEEATLPPHQARSTVASPLQLVLEDDGGEEAAGLVDDPPSVRAGKKRLRTTADRYAPPAPAAEKKAKVAGGKAKAKAALSKEELTQQRESEKIQRERMREHNVALGLKADGTAWKRGGAYQKHVLPKAKQEAAKVAFTGATAGANAERDRLLVENSKLRAELAVKAGRVQELEAQVKTHDAALTSARASVHMSYITKMEEQFHKGAAFASQVASGQIYTYTPSSAGAGTSRENTNLM